MKPRACAGSSSIRPLHAAPQGSPRRERVDLNACMAGANEAARASLRETCCAPPSSSTHRQGPTGERFTCNSRRRTRARPAQVQSALVVSRRAQGHTRRARADARERTVWLMCSRGHVGRLSTNGQPTHRRSPCGDVPINPPPDAGPYSGPSLAPMRAVLESCEMLSSLALATPLAGCMQGHAAERLFNSRPAIANVQACTTHHSVSLQRDQSPDDSSRTSSRLRDPKGTVGPSHVRPANSQPHPERARPGVGGTAARVHTGRSVDSPRWWPIWPNASATERSSL